MGITNLYKNFFGEKYTGLSNFYNTYVRHNSISTSTDGGLGGLACRVIWTLNFTSYEYTPSNLINGNANTSNKTETNYFLDNISKITRWVGENNMFKHMEGLCCKIEMPNFSITQQVDNTKGKVTIDNREGVYQTVGGSPIWGDKDTIKLTFYETQIPLIEQYIWPWLKQCKYSFITSRDVFSIPRANLHISFYPDDKDTYIAFKYIVYGLYPVVIESFQPSHEKKSSIDKRSVTFAYNNITIDQDTSFTNYIVSHWDKQTVGVKGESKTTNKKSSNDNQNYEDTSKRIKATLINNNSITDKEKSDREKLYGTILLNGSDDPNDSDNLIDTTEELTAPTLNGGNNGLNTNGSDSGVNGNDSNKNKYLLNGGDDSLIDTTQFLKPTSLTTTNDYLKTYGKTTKSSSLNTNSLAEKIKSADQSVSLEEALAESENNDSDSNTQAKTDAANSNLSNSNVGESTRLQQLSDILNQLRNSDGSSGSSSDGSNGSNSTAKSLSDSLKDNLKNNTDSSSIYDASNSHNNSTNLGESKGQARTYSVVKDLRNEEEETGWGKSGGGDYIDVGTSNSTLSKIKEVSAASSSSQTTSNTTSDISSQAATLSSTSSSSTTSSVSNISSKVQSVTTSSKTTVADSKTSLNTVENKIESVTQSDSSVTTKSDINDKLIAVTTKNNGTSKISNDDISKKMNDSDLSISLDEAIEMYENQSEQSEENNN